MSSSSGSGRSRMADDPAASAAATSASAMPPRPADSTPTSRGSSRDAAERTSTDLGGAEWGRDETRRCTAQGSDILDSSSSVSPSPAFLSFSILLPRFCFFFLLWFYPLIILFVYCFFFRLSRRRKDKVRSILTHSLSISVARVGRAPRRMHALSRPVHRCFSRARLLPAAAAMGSSARDPSGNPTVGRLRELFRGGGDAADGWEKSWESGVTPWDLGKPTPIIEHLVKSGTLPKGRALVPGCGMGYDVVALASPERFVVGLEISNIATEKAKQWSSSLPNADRFSFLVADFFKWRPNEPFDLIFDYTFFCALDPSLRLAWAETVGRLLKPDGELITLIYLISDQEGGPPYNNTVADYQKVLEPLGFKAVCMEDNELAIKPRKGCEKLGRWKRCGGPRSSM